MSEALLDPVTVVRASRRGRRRRLRRTLGALVGAVVVMFFVDVLLGSYTVTVPDFLAILGGAELPGASFIVWENKLPRAVLGLLVGLAFGVSGAVFQTLLRNPLASPDIVGVTAGASTAATATIEVARTRAIFRIVELLRVDGRSVCLANVHLYVPVRLPDH